MLNIWTPVDINYHIFANILFPAICLVIAVIALLILGLLKQKLPNNSWLYKWLTGIDYQNPIKIAEKIECIVTCTIILLLVFITFYFS